MWRKQNRKFSLYFRIMGLVMLIVGIGLIVDGIGDYADQSHQKDWISIEATVTDVSSEEDTSSTLHSSHSTYYIMAYEYAVDGETYTGRTGRMSSPHLIGTAITVKYNPEMPEENTAILSPNTHDLVVLLILGTAIAVVGFFSLGVELFRISCERSTLRAEGIGPETDIGLIQRPIAKSRQSSGSPTCAWLLAFVAVILS